jgi:hypothetical protein
VGYEMIICVYIDIYPYIIYLCMCSCTQRTSTHSLLCSANNYTNNNKVYLTDLAKEDLKAIVMDQFPSMKDILYKAPPPSSSSKARGGEELRRPSMSMLDISIDLCSRLHREIVEEKHFGRQGAPWEFNLRDILRFCHLLQRNHHDPLHAVDVLYTQRMRTHDDRKRVHLISCDILGLECTAATTTVVVSRHAEEEDDDGKGGGRRRRRRSRVEKALPQDPAEEEEAPPVVRVSPSHVQIEGVFLRRGGSRAKLSLNQGASAELNLSPYSSLLPPYFPTFQLRPLKTIARCVDMNWPCLLVGSAESGCVPLLRTFARLCGHILHEIPISPGTDSSDLIGCFEQVNVAQETESLFTNASDLVREALQVLAVEVFQVLTVAPDSKLLLERTTTTTTTTTTATAAATVEERRRMVQNILEDWSLACCSYKMRSQQQEQDRNARDCTTAVEAIRNVVLLTQTALHTCIDTQHESWPCLSVALEETSAKLEAFCARQLRKGHSSSSGGGGWNPNPSPTLKP